MGLEQDCNEKSSGYTAYEKYKTWNKRIVKQSGFRARMILSRNIKKLSEKDIKEVLMVEKNH